MRGWLALLGAFDWVACGILWQVEESPGRLRILAWVLFAAGAALICAAVRGLRMGPAAYLVTQGATCLNVFVAATPGLMYLLAGDQDPLVAMLALPWLVGSVTLFSRLGRQMRERV